LVVAFFGGAFFGAGFFNGGFLLVVAFPFPVDVLPLAMVSGVDTLLVCYISFICTLNTHLFGTVYSISKL
jgi:hypothetical protein